MAYDGLVTAYAAQSAELDAIAAAAAGTGGDPAAVFALQIRSFKATTIMQQVDDIARDQKTVADQAAQHDQ